MFFQILGPVSVTVDGLPVRVGRSRQLTVLALLLINIDKLVPVGRLVDAVWGATPPATADKQIQTCVWRLRTAFEQAGAPAELIETVSGGYQLRMDGGVLDAHLFEDGVRTARELHRRGEVSAAIAEYRSALALFHGPLMAELASPTVQTMAAHWEERRLSVLEERLDVELATGCHAELVSELRVLVAEYPLREHLRAQLMTALYLSHRRADALAVYRAGRATMVASLGLEPGPRLQELQRRIIAGEPLTHPGGAVRPRPTAKAPAQLPADTADFTGRDHELTCLADHLCRSGRGGVVAVVGRPGVGKTALAVHAAHRVRDRFPDGQLHADLGGSTGRPATPHDVLAGFLRALGVSDEHIPSDVATRAALFRSATAGRRLLVVLDDAAGSAHVEPLRPADTGAVLCTSRTTMLDLPGVDVHRLDGLRTDEATALLAHVVGEHRVAREPAGARRLVELCGNLPLAVRAAGARLHARPTHRIDRFADRLTDDSRRVAELSYGTLDLGARLGTAADALPGPARAVWLLLGASDLPTIPVWAAAALVDRSEDETQCLLDTLVDHHLLDVAEGDVLGGSRYRLHPLVRIHARQRCRTEIDTATLATALDRLGEVASWLSARATDIAGGRAQPAAIPAVVERTGCSVLRELDDQATTWLHQEHTTLALLTSTGVTRPRRPELAAWGTRFEGRGVHDVQTA
ncbi:AfsR/SARP family transcriptional regulator [Actinosynnema pretiosum]|uniref:AfsR/SARP family transcriptional regulator n=1 Tax=Actinosynnema pretiosum TaxID=42197 RepID=UPI0015A5960C|nr:AfsR/SARP family transcriptional regulator [Actinosynnema pretiosum]